MPSIQYGRLEDHTLYCALRESLDSPASARFRWRASWRASWRAPAKLAFSFAARNCRGMTRRSIAEELENAADRIAEIARADLQIILRRAALMLRNVAGVPLDPMVADALDSIAAEMNIGRPVCCASGWRPTPICRCEGLTRRAKPTEAPSTVPRSHHTRTDRPTLPQDGGGLLSPSLAGAFTPSPPPNGRRPTPSEMILTLLESRFPVAVAFPLLAFVIGNACEKHRAAVAALCLAF